MGKRLKWWSGQCASSDKVNVGRQLAEDGFPESPCRCNVVRTIEHCQGSSQDLQAGGQQTVREARADDQAAMSSRR
ncbi:uncharacterized protein LOC103177279 [Callorhinchus milii]|uniref:uncharacterized protein LOC103177279 n=1 Tax=Callorhinchus milii TaxID=7868 RepID=UPI001C3FB53D|nr:uncharacterized protein LOC103177279 [Callorhinchus milii]